MTKKVYQSIASLLNAIENCKKTKNEDWEIKHTDRLEKIINETAPNGSGIDCGTEINFEESNPEKLVFNFSFHHMSEHGHYTHWTEHKLTVFGSLAFEVELRIVTTNKGRIDNDLKNYFYETFEQWLTSETKE